MHIVMKCFVKTSDSIQVSIQVTPKSGDSDFTFSFSEGKIFKIEMGRSYNFYPKALSI